MFPVYLRARCTSILRTEQPMVWKGSYLVQLVAIGSFFFGQSERVYMYQPRDSLVLRYLRLQNSSFLFLLYQDQDQEQENNVVGFGYIQRSCTYASLVFNVFQTPTPHKNDMALFSSAPHHSSIYFVLIILSQNL